LRNATDDHGGKAIILLRHPFFVAVAAPLAVAFVVWTVVRVITLWGVPKKLDAIGGQIETLTAAHTEVATKLDEHLADEQDVAPMVREIHARLTEGT